MSSPSARRISFSLKSIMIATRVNCLFKSKGNSPSRLKSKFMRRKRREKMRRSQCCCFPQRPNIQPVTSASTHMAWIQVNVYLFTWSHTIYGSASAEIESNSTARPFQFDSIRWLKQWCWANDINQGWCWQITAMERRSDWIVQVSDWRLSLFINHAIFPSDRSLKVNYGDLMQVELELDWTIGHGWGTWLGDGSL